MSENNPQNIDELLRLFVSTDEMRAKFMRPWRERNHVYASECHILIRVSDFLTDADYPEHNSGNTDKLIPKGLPNGIITLARLDKTLANAPLVDELKTVGAEGWEIASVIEDSMRSTSIILKRETLHQS